MARIRSIKPEAFTSETLAGQSVHARWTFAGLWTYVDDDGRGRANAGLIKAAVWPLDDDVTPKHVGAILDELEDALLICRYEVDGKGYLHVVNFDEHQHPNRPLPSKLPACTRRTHGGLSASSVSLHPKGPAGGAAAGSAPSEVKSAPEAPQTAITAGQRALSEDAVSTHGADTTKSPSTPPTPLRNEQGEGVGEGKGDGVPPTAGAGKPRAATRTKPRTSSGNAGDVVAAYVDGALAAKLPRPDETLRKRVGKQAGEMLARGEVTLEALVDAARHMGASGWNDLAVQIQRDAAGSNGSSTNNRGSSGGKKTNYTDEEYQSGW